MVELKEYMAIKCRMVKADSRGSCSIECLECPLSDKNNGIDVGCQAFENKYPEKAEKVIEQWAKEHPVKTYAQDFFEKHPNARKDEFGRPKICREDIYGGGCRDDNNCVDCWNEPMEDTRQAPPIGYCATCSRRGTEYTAETCDGEKLYDCELMYEPVFLSGFCDGYKPKEDENG